MNIRSKIYVHCGLHKTGTTALQAALRDNEDILRRRGYLFPWSGSLAARGAHLCKPAEAGHHNIAWELTRDRRYSTRHGGLGALCAEIASFPGDIILSSEDFETILTMPERFSPLAELAGATARDLVLVVYFRNQLSYLESVYGQLLQEGFGQEYARCAETVLASGTIQRNEWIFQFDYRRICEAWDRAPDITLLVRDYHAFSGPALINDFAETIGLGAFVDPASGGKRMVNDREPIMRGLARFYRNRIGRNLTPMEAARVRRICSNLPSRLGSGPALGKAFAARFNSDNEAVCLRNNLSLSGLAIGEAPSVDHPVSLAELFSFETQCAIRFGTPNAEGADEPSLTVTLPVPEIATLAPPRIKRRKKLKYLLNNLMERFYFQDLEFFDI